ncbi:hypothetical protein [Mumia zhuanghuii]|uniref:Uncharacterized protein n=1 Tax=Mumia zhuanghuii TaxID=2585211 RepID=A0A5C4M497_9ACTN|nr:hypothetical protein [Mumia zhuanghuii]TNC27969.1 hypothetical protein FHE65_34065 [Mumia zhuanghuii]
MLLHRGHEQWSRKRWPEASDRAMPHRSSFPEALRLDRALHPRGGKAEFANARVDFPTLPRP